MVEDKMRTDVYILYGVTGDSVTTETIIPRKKRNMKSPAMSPPRKDLITNQYINIIITEKIKVFHHT